jgi:DNA-binding transcriptional LysR family regulator
MIELRDIDAFMRVAAAGSLSRAARVYDVPKATLSLSLRRLEDQLGASLFDRQPRRMALTEAGAEYLRHCREIVTACERATAAVQASRETLSGNLRLAAGTVFATSFFGPLAQRFAAAHPQLSIELLTVLYDRDSLHELDVDCLLMIGTPAGAAADHVARLVARFAYGLWASPSYLQSAGTPLSIHDLDRHQGLLYIKEGKVEPWRLAQGKRTVELAPIPRIKVNDYWLLKYLAMQGMGIAYMPTFFVRNETGFGALVPVLEAWQSTPVPVYALFPKQRADNVKVRRFVDTLVAGFDEIHQKPPIYALVQQPF